MSSLPASLSITQRRPGAVQITMPRPEGFNLFDEAREGSAAVFVRRAPHWVSD